MKTLYFTEQGLQKHMEKIESLNKEIKDMQSPTSVSDLERGNYEDNPSYVAQQTIAIPNSKVQTLKSELSNIQVVTFPQSVDEVCIGCSVEIKLDGKRFRYDILGYGESDPKENKMSYTAPIAKALLGQKPGFSCNIDICNSYKKLELIELSPLKED